jgi:hypothetical protein
MNQYYDPSKLVGHQIAFFPRFNRAGFIISGHGLKLYRDLYIMKAGGLYQSGWHNFKGILGKFKKVSYYLVDCSESTKKVNIQPIFTTKERNKENTKSDLQIFSFLHIFALNNSGSV